MLWMSFNSIEYNNGIGYCDRLHLSKHFYESYKRIQFSCLCFLPSLIFVQANIFTLHKSV